MIFKEYANDKVNLHQLSLADAESFYGLYQHPELAINFDECAFLPNETPKAFTGRIISLCECIFTIRMVNQSDLVIGECALHHLNQATNEITIGGSLYPEYWGKGLMLSAFGILANIASQEFGVKTLLASTKTKNSKAIRFAEKMGFTKYKVEGNETMMKKAIINYDQFYSNRE
ncbi:N-acetyltransferase [Mucilaginibacter limnophilus]|uniref:N-acetyltransferase n=1 Tax=Mucilaginibacter limnophilus TaxID=1932778 RepID=A0A3S2Y0Q0_9SPHI|nr:GNAT family N-acetyltransferase [Mucilaginibacter limnophilus]RVT97214.1 N-acetyltransferase [Mucilaginibacter limnophilus]